MARPSGPTWALAKRAAAIVTKIWLLTIARSWFIVDRWGLRVHSRSQIVAANTFAYGHEDWSVEMTTQYGEAEQEFSVVVKRAVLIPEAAAIREFVRELQAEAAANPSLQQEFAQDPRAFLGKRGISADIQRELLAEAGVAGAGEFGCTFLSCVFTDGCATTEISITII